MYLDSREERRSVKAGSCKYRVINVVCNVMCQR